MPDTFPEDHLLIAAIDLLGRTGAASTSIRYCEDDEPTTEPVAWVALAHYELAEGAYWEAAGAMSPTRAVLRLCETMMDGGTCLHCQRPSAFDSDSLDAMPANDAICWYQYDPELKTFRRGCEGST